MTLEIFFVNSSGMHSNNKSSAPALSKLKASSIIFEWDEGSLPCTKNPPILLTD